MARRISRLGSISSVRWSHIENSFFFSSSYLQEFAFALAREHDDEARGFFGVYSGVVDEHGVGGAHERRDFAFAIAFIAHADFFQDFGQSEMVPFFLVFFPAALGAYFR